MPTKADMVSIR